MTDSQILRCISPVDGRVYVERPAASDAEIARAFAQARAAQAEWVRVPIATRAIYCERAVAAMVSMTDDIVPELAWQMGRPVRFGPAELRGFAERARHMIAIAEDALAPVEPGQTENFARRISREPLGIVFTIAPWNYPYLTAVNSIIPALMAGNAVVLKHARQTLLAGGRFADAFAAAGLPEGLFHHLVLSHQQAAGIISDRMADMICFTGSARGGGAIERAAAGQFLFVGLELGGKDPAYLRADADLAFATPNLVDGAFFNSGQSCCGVERIYVDEEVYDPFVEGFVERARHYVLGDPLAKATTLGPMIDADAASLVRGQIEAALAAGAVAHIDENSFKASKAGTPYLAPQVLTGVNHQMAVMFEESFGPVVGIMKVRGEAAAVQLMNDSPFGLTASIWTSDEAAANRIGAQIETGTVFMNRCDYLDPALAWTGVKASGRGSSLSHIGYEQLTRPKSYHFRTKTSD